MQRKAYIQLTESNEHVPTEVLGGRQWVTYLLNLLKTDNSKILAGTAAVKQDELGKRVDFETGVTFLLPFDLVTSKNVKTKGLGVNVWNDC